MSLFKSKKNNNSINQKDNEAVNINVNVDANITENISLSNDLNQNTSVNSPKLSIKILGEGCDKCNELVENTKAAVKELNVNADIEHVENLLEIIKYGVMSSPALLVNDKTEALGRVLKKKEIVEILKKYM